MYQNLIFANQNPRLYMKKLKRLLTRFFLLVLLITLAVLVYNTIRYSSKQTKVEAIPEIEVKDKIVERLAQAIQIPTISYATHIDTAAFVQFNQYLDSSFDLINTQLETHTINTYSRIYKWQGKNTLLKPILFMAHIDVVPIEVNSREEWAVEPFSGKTLDGYLYGRGAIDDKMSLVGVLEAIEMLVGEGYRPNRTIYLAFGHDEEVGGQNGAQAIAGYFKKKRIKFDYILDEGSLVTEGNMPGLSRSLGLIGIAEKGYTTLTLTARTNGGHSSIPPTQTAIGVLSKAIATLEAEPMSATFEGPTGLMLDYAGPETNFLMRMVLANPWLFGKILKKELSKKPTSNAIIRTTTATTMINGGVKDNVLPTHASAKINFRIHPTNTIDEVFDYVKKTVNDDRIKIEIDPKGQNPSKISDHKGFGFQVIQRTLQEIFTDAVVAPSLVVAATDSRYFAEVAENTYRFMPVQLNNEELKGFHGINERLSIDNYKQAVRFYYRLIRNSCQ